MAKSFEELTKRTMSKAARQRAQERADEILGELLLAELRQATGTTQKELAARLGIKQPTLARMERQSDIQVSTLQRLVGALGGELEITARFPKGCIALKQFQGQERSKKVAARSHGKRIVARMRGKGSTHMSTDEIPGLTRVDR